MANTYTQVYIQIVFAVKGHQNLIQPKNKETLQKFITGIVKNRGQKLLAIHSMPDHTHLLVGLEPNISISDLVRDVKPGSSKFINESDWVKEKFNWQVGYGAFSYSRSQIDNVIKYINNQVEHHQKRTFQEEYIDFLNKFNVEFEEKYLFDWIEG
ncbi:transposase [Roseivirga seohaensis subsp. aquiponti]|uniref:Transposase n=2 Tax=Roseivirga seohaensis TaxID=1914963 RepID=A0A0L8AKR9_9BACT|nr:transposase [Roseivirga seohaensis subsp. aquiponti]